jgi:glycosyltransferase involved in cell wall biosynthesis
MPSQNIICFAKDWDEDPTSCNHVMRALSRGNRVLWLNSICARRPDFASGRDLRKIGRKLMAFLKGPTEVAPNLWVYTPLVLPFPYTYAATAVNRWILRATVKLLRARLGMRDFQLWTFLPTTAAYVGVMGESVSVYYCTDEWAGFEHLGGEPVAAMEQALCKKVDLVFTTSRPLRERKAVFNDETHLASHGVDHAHFATAVDEGTPVATELRYLARPIVGFFGLIESWIDVGLLVHLAESRPDWSIVLIGRAAADVSRLRRYPNVSLLGRRPYSELPSYAKGFDVAVCPFVMNELTRCINPIKLREYLSAGLPVVATAIPEAAAFSRSCRLVDSPAGFLAACEDAVRDDSPEQRRRRSEEMRHETWERKAGESLQIALRVKAAKVRPAGDRMPGRVIGVEV